MGSERKQKSKFNWDLWKLNAKLLQDDLFVERVRECLMRDNYDRGSENCFEATERFKQNAKTIAIERSSQVCREERREQNELRNLLAQLLPGSFTSVIKSVKMEIEAKDAEKYKGAAIRARGEKLLAGEQPTKRALADQKSYARKQEISRTVYCGAIKEEPKAIMNAFTEHYMELFENKAPPKGGFETEF
ncbi:hypothetical protein HPB48_002449 [Haemaphysalis longicornis]|uniref:Uncharacterized protein n=1 Tax=Haemaphysalis longicornis TaxID=44386 RepID=A0A9J6FA49_HAELO|nr:hypothetical protein HPB48_002449 [Haemaphysalis longicornis]